MSKGLTTKTLKLTSGEEIIATILNFEDPDRYYMLEYPLRVEHWIVPDEDGQVEEGYDLVPFLIASEDHKINLKTSAVAAVAEVQKFALRRYRRICDEISNNADAMEMAFRRPPKQSSKD